MIIRRAKAKNRHTKTRGILQQFSPAMFQFPVSRSEPNLDGSGGLEKIVNVPMWFGRRFQVMTDTRMKSTRAKGTAHVSIKAGDNVEFSQAADSQPFHLRHPGNQDVGTFVRW